MNERSLLFERIETFHDVVSNLLIDIVFPSLFKTINYIICMTLNVFGIYTTKLVQNLSLIKNFHALLAENSDRKIVLEAVEKALHLANPLNIIPNKLLYDVTTQELTIEGRMISLSKFRKIFVIAFGKASIPMTEGLYQVLLDKISSGLVISPFIRETNLPRDKFEIITSSHPNPDEKSSYAADKIVDFLDKNVTENDLLIILISGGGTSLVFKPIHPLSVSEFLKVNSLLLKSGLSIQEINIVRKHLSVFGGGKLLKYIRAKKILSLIISDVVGDDISTIASGPTSPDSSSFSDVKAILEKAQLYDKLPISAITVIEDGLTNGSNETVKPGSPLLKRVENIVIFKNLDLLRSIKKFFEEKNIRSLVITSSLVGEAREVGKVIYSIAYDTQKYHLLGEPPLVLLFGGETTVTVTGDGLGGRNQEIALSFLRSMKVGDKLIIASFGTDGIDGPTDAAGAICDWVTKDKAVRNNVDIDRYLLNNDSYHLLQKLNSLIFTGYTGTNVNDVVIVYIS